MIGDHAGMIPIIRIDRDRDRAIGHDHPTREPVGGPQYRKQLTGEPTPGTRTRERNNVE
jgi:hypothetical protein